MRDGRPGRGALHRVEVVDRASRLVRVEAGARWAQVARALAPHGLAISSGDHGNVGVGGIATGGGVGWMVRHYGLTIDHIRAVDVVLPDGTFVRADTVNAPDLLWVMRGAGAGAGIATAFESEAMELSRVGHVRPAAEVDPAGETLLRWAEAMDGAPRELSTAVTPASSGARTTAFVTAVVASGEPAVIRDAVAPLLGIGGVTAQQGHVAPYPALLPTEHLHASIGQMPVATTNGLLTGMAPDAARALVAASAGPRPVLVQLPSLGGAVHDVSPSATAFAHRHQTTLVIGSAFPPDGREALAAAWAPVAPHTDGVHVNFESTSDAGAFARAYPGPADTRVTARWRRYDPEGLLRPGPRADAGPGQRTPVTPRRAQ